MGVTLFSFFLLPLCLVWIMSPDKLLRLMAMVSCFEAAAAFVIGGFGVQPGLVPTLAFMGYVLLQFLLGARYPGTAAVWRLAFPFVLVTFWAVASSYLMPRVFEGTVSVWPQRQAFPYVLTPLVPNPSNINQDISLVINCAFMILAACYLTRSRVSLAPFLRAYLMSGFIVAGVSAWQFASRVAGVPFPDELFYSNPGWAILTAQNIGAVPRINGPFSEPAALAGYMASIVCATGWLLLQGRRERMFKWLFAVGLMTMAISTSTTGFAVLALVSAGVIVAALVGRSTRMIAAIVKIGLPLALAIGGMLLVASVFVPSFNQNVAAVFDATVNKQQSSSYEDRTGADLDSLAEVFATYGLGVGWGSNRSSSLIPGLLAGLGIPGCAALIWFAAALLRQTRAVRRAGCSREQLMVMDACGGALVGFLLAAVVSGPSITSTVFFFLLGLLIACSVRAQIDQRLRQRRAVKPAHVSIAP
jgi:hypothetical protein